MLDDLAPIEALDANAVRRWSGLAVDALVGHRDEVDALNVFPVPDSDTGSNLLMTLRAADAALRSAAPDDPVAALAAMAAGAAQAAVGNSGFIVSQLLRGLADAAAKSGRCDAETLALGLALGTELGHDAVVGPLEGTILTVAGAAAVAAADHATSLAGAARAAVAAADAALQRTPSQLPPLAEAGVVDAGGRGLVLLLAALARVVTGDEIAIQPVSVPARESAGASVGYEFEVQYHLETADAAALRPALAAVGDSVAVIATGPGEWNVHVHVDDVGAAIEAGLQHGRVSAIAVSRLLHEARTASGPVAVVAVAPGAGLAHLFAREGVHVVEGGPADRPAVNDVARAIEASAARELVLLPNASRVAGVAEAAAAQAREHGRRVSVVPTRSPVQGLAAVAVHDPARPFDDDVVAMAEAAAATRFAEVTVAGDRALTAVGICEPGDVLGLIDGEVVEIGHGLLAVAFSLVDRLLAVGAELMTVVVGAAGSPRIGAQIGAHVRERSPLVDVTVVVGGQPDLPVIIGVE